MCTNEVSCQPVIAYRKSNIMRKKYTTANIFPQLQFHLTKIPINIFSKTGAKRVPTFTS